MVPDFSGFILFVYAAIFGAMFIASTVLITLVSLIFGPFAPWISPLASCVAAYFGTLVCIKVWNLQ